MELLPRGFPPQFIEEIQQHHSVGATLPRFDGRPEQSNNLPPVLTHVVIQFIGRTTQLLIRPNFGPAGSEGIAIRGITGYHDSSARRQEEQVVPFA